MIGISWKGVGICFGEKKEADTGRQVIVCRQWMKSLPCVFQCEMKAEFSDSFSVLKKCEKRKEKASIIRGIGVIPPLFSPQWNQSFRCKHPTGSTMKQRPLKRVRGSRLACWFVPTFWIIYPIRCSALNVVDSRPTSLGRARESTLITKIDRVRNVAWSILQIFSWMKSLLRFREKEGVNSFVRYIYI